MNNVDLTDEELCLLDGKCSPKVQAIIQSVLERIALQKSLPNVEPHISTFINDVLVWAKENGQLILQYKPLRSCKYCKKHAGYALHTRSGKYHRKGQTNHNKPLTFAGRELAHSFISWQGSATCGCCNECFDKAKPALLEKLKDLQVEMPETLTGIKPQWKKYDLVKCKDCGWQGHEGEMRQKPALMGGYYPGGCPKCKAENNFFGPTKVERIKGFAMVKMA